MRNTTVGQPDFSTLAFTLNGSEIRYGAFLTVVVNLLLPWMIVTGRTSGPCRRP